MRHFLSCLQATAAAATLLAFTSAQAETIKIGLLLSQSGPLASYGVSMKAAAEYAVKAINDAGGVNGNELAVITEDDGSNPTNFLNGLNRLIETEKVHALVGPITSGFYQAGAPITVEKGVLMISPTATAPNLTTGIETAFRNNPSEADNIPKLLELVKSTHPDAKTISILYDKKQAADRIIGELYEQLAPKAGWEVQEVVSFLSGQMSYGDIVAKALRNGPDLVAVAAHAENAANVARELRRRGYEGPILGGTPTVSADYIKIGGAAVENTLVVVPYYYGATQAVNEAFTSGYAQMTGNAKPDPWEASTFECIGLIAHAIKQAGIAGDPANLAAERALLHKTLAAVRDYPGLIGPISFDKERVAQKATVIIKVKDGDWHAL
ncbi:ABC transporter substrate-binding protein [Oceanibacterium hippocampi]|uniref:Leucine-binding protein domain-containing protein n=1 Tax=Oceanibacterium hippocampi TaxID=745714 RepID=A0A1Y5TVG5_9PROT|nr:ABC transporter substrate-binding protein [Oceanibacterium hippocampi]SLN70730.1 hypothetical protein OCH7691_03315 [Oceanibacterium hippocampi]